MKKCTGCEREIDKHGIACQYCGKLIDKQEKECEEEEEEEDSTRLEK